MSEAIQEGVPAGELSFPQVRVLARGRVGVPTGRPLLLRTPHRRVVYFLGVRGVRDFFQFPEGCWSQGTKTLAAWKQQKGAGGIGRSSHLCTWRQLPSGSSVDSVSSWAATALGVGTLTRAQPAGCAAALLQPPSRPGLSVRY